jgi:hypothetical protein
VFPLPSFTFAFLFPRFCRGFPPSLLCCAAYQLSVLDTLASNHREHFKEAIRVIAFAAIESKRLFV